MTLLWIYLAAVSVISLFITVHDKIAAKAGWRRIPEKTLIVMGLIGGAEIMYITMLIIRHKTKHAKFMVGLPLIILLHGGIAAGILCLI